MSNVQTLTEVGGNGWVTFFIIAFAIFFIIIEILKGWDVIAGKFGFETKHERRLRSIEDRLGIIETRLENTEKEVATYKDIRNHDREQSFQIQNTLLDAIECIKVANRVVLGDRINQKYKYYTRIQGIPEDEFDEFVNLHDAYKGIGGNHGGDQKFEKAIKYRIIPVDEMIEKDLY